MDGTGQYYIKFVSRKQILNVLCHMQTLFYVSVCVCVYIYVGVSMSRGQRTRKGPGEGEEAFMERGGRILENT